MFGPESWKVPSNSGGSCIGHAPERGSYKGNLPSFFPESFQTNNRDAQRSFDLAHERARYP